MVGHPRHDRRAMVASSWSRVARPPTTSPLLPKANVMPYDIPHLLQMSQPDLDALFTASNAGPIPAGQADGTAIIAPGTVYSPEIAAFISTFAWQGKVFDPESGTLKNRIGPFGLNAILAKVYKAPSWLHNK